jgi:tetratricopeptide (TPR) repeat protein
LIRGLTYVCVVAAAALAGCTPRLAPLDTAAPGVSRNAAPVVDPLIVGDRLLAAGEAELALDAYIRAAKDHGVTPEISLAISSANIALGRLGQAERDLRSLLDEDAGNVGAWNNLGVVLMERNATGEAKRSFETAFALDNGNSAEIRENLRVALAKMENTTYTEEQTAFTLVRRGNGVFTLSRRP